MSIHLYKDELKNTTAVSNYFIDQLMPKANGEFVKVYLYLLRCLTLPEHSISISAIADALNNTEADIQNAIRYWEQLRVLDLNLEENEIRDIHLLSVTEMNDYSISQASAEKESPKQNSPSSKKEQEDDSSNEAPANKPMAQIPIKAEKSSIPEICTEAPEKEPLKHHNYSMGEIEKFKKDESIRLAFAIIESYIKHQLNYSTMETIIYWMDALHLSLNLVVYLVETCIGGGHDSFYYMNKIAQDWHNKNISSVEEAKRESLRHSEVINTIQKSFGISNRRLGETEMSFINKWINDYGFDAAIIAEACDRTLIKTQKPSFQYANSILTSWYKQNVRTKEDIAAKDREYEVTKESSRGASKSNVDRRKNNFSNFDQKGYDYDELEKFLIETKV